MNPVGLNLRGQQPVAPVRPEDASKSSLLNQEGLAVGSQDGQKVIEQAQMNRAHPPQSLCANLFNGVSSSVGFLIYFATLPVRAGFNLFTHILNPPKTLVDIKTTLDNLEQELQDKGEIPWSERISHGKEIISQFFNVWDRVNEEDAPAAISQLCEMVRDDKIPLESLLDHERAPDLIRNASPEIREKLLNSTITHIKELMRTTPHAQETIQELLSCRTADLKEASPDEIKKYVEFLKKSMLICFKKQDPKVASLIKAELSQLGVTFTDSELQALRKLCLLNPSLIDICIDSHSDPMAAKQQLLDIALAQNEEALVAIMLQKMEVGKEKLEEYADTAIKQSNLTMARMLSSDTWLDKATEYFDQEVAKGENENAPRDFLVNFFLNSNLEETYLLLNHLQKKYPDRKDILEAREFVKTSGNFIARFPNPADQDEMHAKYGGYRYSSYAAQQQAFGKSRFDRVSETLKILKQDPSKSLFEVYKSLIAPKENWRSQAATTPQGGRYARFIQLNVATADIAATSPHTKGLILETRGMVTFTTSDPSGETRNLTALTYNPMPMYENSSASGFIWSHTGAPGTTRMGMSVEVRRNPEIWFEQVGISQDFSNLVNMKVDPGNAEKVKEFQRKVGEFYWKGVHLMPTDSGNSQTMLELHHMLYMHHGLQPPALDRQWVLPDCVALCNTLDEFMKRYNEVWDVHP